MVEETLKRRHKASPARLLEKNESQVMVSHAEFFEALVNPGVVLGSQAEHAAVNFRPLLTGAPQRFPPRREGQDRLGAEPGDPLLERDLVGIRLQEARPPEIVERVSHRAFRSYLSERAGKIELPFERRPV